MDKEAVARERLRVAQARRGRTPMRVGTLLRKERDGTLYKDAAVAGAFALQLVKAAAELTEGARDRVASKNFAISARQSSTGKPAYPIEHASHARAALSMVSAHGTPDQKREVVNDILRKYPALARRSKVVADVKEAGALGRLGGVLRSPGAREHLPEIAGLGVLAIPGLDTLQARARAHLSGDKSTAGTEKRRLLGEGAHAGLDVGGLGILMAPELKHLRSAR
jgi:hypothetical protein